MAGNLLVVNADGPETRVALVEQGQLVELYVERHKERSIVGNIYKGRVRRVLPGMQAAFVDIGQEKAAFLYVADVRGAPEDFKSLFDDEDPRTPVAKEAKEAPRARIEELVKEGQDILLQVAKEPIGSKGARSTTYVSLPGRNLVFMPTVDHIGISRRIDTDKERKRLRHILETMRPEGTGFIARTVADGVSEQELHSDMEFLMKLWNAILKKNKSAKAPTLLYNDLDLLLRSVRDLFTPDVEKLIVDSSMEYERLRKFVGTFMPDFLDKIELYKGNEPIFDGYGIEAEIDRTLQRKVALRSGGSLVFDQGEALTAIDVNTGKFVGKRSLEETITKTNLEACEEIAIQLRLRNIGGMIVVDFIDMDRESNRAKVMNAFAEVLKSDKAKANVTSISELGLVEMTRKRTRESLGRLLTEACPYCDGKGYIKSKTTICAEILRQLRRNGRTFTEGTLVVTAHPEIVSLLTTVERAYLEELERRLNKKIIVRPVEQNHLEKFTIQPQKLDRGTTPKPSATPEAQADLQPAYDPVAPSPLDKAR